MGTKLRPGRFDCYGAAHDDEPVFVLLGRDKAAPEAVRHWAMLRVRYGKNGALDEQVIEALSCAAAMDDYKPAPRKVPMKDKLVRWCSATPGRRALSTVVAVTSFPLWALPFAVLCLVRVAHDMIWDRDIGLFTNRKEGR